MTMSEYSVVLTELSDVIRISKASNEDAIFTSTKPGAYYVLNQERSVLKRVVYTDPTAWTPLTYHLVSAVRAWKKTLEAIATPETSDHTVMSNGMEVPLCTIMEPDNLNRWLYPTALMNISTNCKCALNAISNRIMNAPMILDTEDMVTDPWYENVFGELFNKGTGRADIIKTKSGFPITIYKGLIPYTSKDKITLNIFNVNEREFVAEYTVSKIKPAKSPVYMDVFIRYLNLYTGK